MLAAYPIASQPLAALPAGGSQHEPVIVTPEAGYRWRVQLMVDGLDMTELMTGVSDVDREEGGAAVAGFTLLLPAGPVVPTDWLGRSVTLDYISTSPAGTRQARLFTGWVVEPVWDPTTRLLDCDCSDRLQQRVEALELAQIEALTPDALWSEDAFEPLSGRQRWDYMQERLSTLPASLDSSTTGTLRVSSWYASAVPHFVFGGGSTVYQSLQLDLQQYDQAINRVELEINYRLQRLWEHAQTWSWAHPYAAGAAGGFCGWRTWSTELPTRDMIVDAVSGAGLELVGSVGGFVLPPSAPNLCGDGVPWQNAFGDLHLSASVTGARRWTQSVTETYKLVLTAPGGDEAGRQNVQRDSLSVSVGEQAAEGWEDARPVGTTQAVDTSDDPRRQLAIRCLLAQAVVQMVDGHRGTSVSWQVLADMALDIDLQHTLLIEDQGIRAQGKVRRISFDLDMLGAPLATLTIAVMRGGGSSSPLSVPARPDTSLPLPSGGKPAGTQLGGRLTDPVTGFPIGPHDPDRMGFSGNFSVADDLTATRYPYQFALEALEIPESYRDEAASTVEAAYTVGIPNDLLEM